MAQQVKPMDFSMLSNLASNYRESGSDRANIFQRQGEQEAAIQLEKGKNQANIFADTSKTMGGIFSDVVKAYSLAEAKKDENLQKGKEFVLDNWYKLQRAAATKALENPDIANQMIEKGHSQLIATAKGLGITEEEMAKPFFEPLGDGRVGINGGTLTEKMVEKDPEYAQILINKGVQMGERFNAKVNEHGTVIGVDVLGGKALTPMEERMNLLALRNPDFVGARELGPNPVMSTREIDFLAGQGPLTPKPTPESNANLLTEEEKRRGQRIKAGLEPRAINPATVNTMEGIRKKYAAGEPLSEWEGNLLQHDLSKGNSTLEVGPDGAIKFQTGSGFNKPTNSVQTNAQNQLDNIKSTKRLISQTREYLKPENVGLIGDMRGLAYGAGQQADAFGQLLKREASVIAENLGSGEISPSNFYDPDLSKLGLLGNVLSYKLALVNNPDGRISDQDYKAAKKSLGFDKLFEGSGSIESRLNAFEEILSASEDVYRRRLGIVNNPHKQSGAKTTRPPLDSFGR